MNIKGTHYIIPSMIVLLIVASCQPAPSTESATISDSATSTPTATTVPPTPTPTETLTPTATPVPHEDIPGELPPDYSNRTGDADSSVTAHQNRAPSGDRFTLGRFERPFNAETMDQYFPHLDIQEAQYFVDETWYFAKIILKGTDEYQALPGRYALEIDVNLDGGGDWLVLVERPSTTEWSTEGLQVWFDGNDDVGGDPTIIADSTQNRGDGYESELFNNGQGDDPDLAWVRISLLDQNSIQIAFKRTMLEGIDKFLIGAWAGNSALDPARFDLNDRYTHEGAGAAMVELEYFYPIKALSELDNVCRVAIGFFPNIDLPGACPIPAREKEDGGEVPEVPVEPQ